MRLLVTDLAASLSLLSRVPVPVDHAAAGARGARAAWAWPIAGAILAVLAALPGLVLSTVGVPPALAAGVSLGALVMMTGAMHEDGLADSADGLWGGWDPARRLEIMKDSRVGVYGVIALVLSLGLRWIAMATLLDAGPLAFLAGLVAVAALSRAAMAVVMRVLPPARPDGVSARVGTVPAAAARGALAAGGLLGLSAGPVAGLVAAVAAAFAAAAIARLARSKIGGQTGDILGATQQVSEIAALVALCVLLA